MLHWKPILRFSAIRFRFADRVYKSLSTNYGFLATTIEVPNTFFKLDVVAANVLPLLGLDGLEYDSFHADNVSKRLAQKTVQSSKKNIPVTAEEWSRPMVREYRYVDVDLLKPEISTSPKMKYKSCTVSLSVFWLISCMDS